ncbi:MAG: glycosyltransferase family 4 protein, partial [Chloroflexota bacterium]|nr:glycosyltransferase family 4 protein [Chloroflexota bacterium]
MHVLYLSGCRGDTQRYRCDHAAEQLHMLGHTAEVIWQTDPAALEAAPKADIVVLHRPPQTHFVATIMELAAGRPLVYETDDLVFDPALVDQIPIVQETSGQQRQYWRNYALSNARILADCHAVTTSTTPLAERLETAQRRAWVHRNALSGELLDRSEQAHSARSTSRPLTIGYFSGTPSHSHDLALIAPVLARILRRHDALRLLLGGYLTVPSELEPCSAQIERRPFVPWRDVPASMADADVLLAPLDLTNPFTYARSELKYLEAAALHIPLVASPAPAFTQAVQAGETGLLAAGEAAWEEGIERLLGDPGLRTRMGDAAAEHVRQAYTFTALAPALEQTM